MEPVSFTFFVRSCIGVFIFVLAGCLCSLTALTSESELWSHSVTVSVWELMSRLLRAGRLVSRTNTALQILFPPLMAISVGCILGLEGLLGLSDPAVSLPGIPIS